MKFDNDEITSLLTPYTRGSFIDLLDDIHKILSISISNLWDKLGGKELTREQYSKCMEAFYVLTLRKIIHSLSDDTNTLLAIYSNDLRLREHAPFDEDSYNYDNEDGYSEIRYIEHERHSMLWRLLKKSVRKDIQPILPELEKTFHKVYNRLFTPQENVVVSTALVVVETVDEPVKKTRGRPLGRKKSIPTHPPKPPKD